MNKFKILFLTFAIFIVSCLTCFADSPQEYALGLDDKPYYLKISNTNSGRTFIYTFNDYDKSSKYMISYNEYVSNNGKDFTLSSSGSSLSVNVKYFSDLNYLGSNHSEVNDHYISLGYEGVDIIVPPPVAPEIMGLEKIIPHLLEQLKILLPIGVIIFGMLLGTRLVPRLIRLFQ